jgi:cephalosporin hydroxylase
MPLLPASARRRLRDKALAASRRLSTGPEWERHVRDEFALLAPSPGWREQVVDGFHELYYETGEAGGTWKDTTWFGVPTWKVPLDLWVYQELLYQLRPDLIVETGTAHGGSALYLATLCEALGRGEVVSVDVGHWPGRPDHRRHTYRTASSTDPQVVAQVAERADGAGCVLVVLDSVLPRDHVLAVLRSYDGLVTTV